MSDNKTAAIRLRLTPEVIKVLAKAKRQYPALSDPEILKVGLSRMAVESDLMMSSSEPQETRRLAARAVGEDYLGDSSEDLYQLGTGKPTKF